MDYEKRNKLLKLIESIPADQWEITSINEGWTILSKKLKAIIKDIPIVILYREWWHKKRKWYGRIKEKKLIKSYNFDVFIEGPSLPSISLATEINDNFYHDLMEKRDKLKESQVEKLLDELEV